ncbi:MFS transporter [Streptomyces colonosanans]|uniref:MFS transporter n=1 Tax=Streptomyces colonosanans TaxID=1428652 RepID=A0A1S2PGT5_9ACTN|nr:MFS transporter [Streptomyces colonosanans]OIJ92822.1 MFS transporter [Streptomyces colonosanans]
MTYRDVASRQVLTWAVVAVGARMPVAMAPLALVFLARDRPGGYTLGATLAAAYVIGEILGAPLLGMRMRPDPARPHMAAGLAVGAVGFAGLGAFPAAHPVVLAGFAVLAGGAPAAAPGGLRALLTALVPRRAVAQALSAESMLMSGIWAVAPAAVTGLALGAAPRVPLLLGAALMAASVAGLWLLPPGWDTDPADQEGASMFRLLARAWPVYVTGAASLSLLSLAELVLPALLEQRGAAVGWSGPLLTGLAVGSAVGAFVYGLRSWPGGLGARSVVLMFGLSSCVTLAALIPGTAWIAVALVAAGVLQAGAMITRNLSLREAVPESALAAGYSVMYAAVGVGYAATGSLAGALLHFVAPSTAILAGVALTLTLTLAGALGERVRRPASSAVGGKNVVADEATPATGAERAPVRGGSDPERPL